MSRRFVGGVDDDMRGLSTRAGRVRSTWTGSAASHIVFSGRRDRAHASKKVAYTGSRPSSGSPRLIGADGYQTDRYRHSEPVASEPVVAEAATRRCW